VPKQQINFLSPTELCVRNDSMQCSSDSRTQSSDTGVGDESAVVSQVARAVAGQGPMDQRGHLVVDALPHCRKSVQIMLGCACTLFWNRDKLA